MNISNYATCECGCGGSRATGCLRVVPMLTFPSTTSQDRICPCGKCKDGRGWMYYWRPGLMARTRCDNVQPTTVMGAICCVLEQTSFEPSVYDSVKFNFADPPAIGPSVISSDRNIAHA